MARRLRPDELLQRYRRANAEKRRFHGLRHLTLEMLAKIRYMNQVAVSMRTGLLDREAAAQEMELTERQLGELVKQGVMAGVESRPARAAPCNPRPQFRTASVGDIRPGLAVPRTRSPVATRRNARGGSLPVRALHARTLVAAHDRRRCTDVLRSGTLKLDDVAPAAAEILRDLEAHNGSGLLESLQEETPEGLLEMLRVPGLGPARIRLIHDGLHVETLQELEAAARDGRIAALPRFGDKTAEKILTASADLRTAVPSALAACARGRGPPGCARAAHPDVLQVEIAGSIRRGTRSCRHRPRRAACAWLAIARGRGDRRNPRRCGRSLLAR